MPKVSECAQCACAGVAAFCPWPFLCRNCQSVANLNVLVLPHFLAGHFCAKIVRVRPMWMRRCCRIFYLAISALKLSQSTQYECVGVATFSTGSFLCPNFQSVPNVNLLVLPHVISVPKFSECTQCACAGVAAFFIWPFLHPSCLIAPNMNALVLPHFLAGHCCAQIVRVRPMWMRQCSRIFYLAISAPELSECAK